MASWVNLSDGRSATAPGAVGWFAYVPPYSARRSRREHESHNLLIEKGISPYPLAPKRAALGRAMSLFGATGSRYGVPWGGPMQSHQNSRFGAGGTVRHTAVGIVGLCVALSAMGCKVNSTDVDTWKGTMKGPGKIVAVVLAEKYDLPLRTHAALALIQMERQDVDGVAELQHVLQQLPPDTRTAIVDGLVPGLETMMTAAAEKPAATVDEGPPPHQVRAKDAAFLLTSQASAASRDALTAAVIRWYVADFNGRSLAGNFSAEQVVRALGAPAASILVDALSSELPQQALVKLSELIGQLASPDGKAKAGSRLVAIEREMEGEKFIEWLKGKIREQMSTGGAAPDEAKIAKVAELNRHNFIVDGSIPALKYLADQKEVSDRLLEIASSAGTDQKVTDRRTRALQALEGKVSKNHLQQLLALALDNSNPVSVRDYAFDRVGDIRSPDAIPAMWTLVSNASDGRLRWRASELVLALGGPGVIAEFFSKLPGGDTEFAPEELEGYASRMGQMTPLPVELLRAQLSSPNWWQRVIAIRFFERKGVAADVARLSKLAGDSAQTKGKGWPTDQTVGKVAQAAAAALQDRLKQSGSGAAQN